MNRKIIHNFPIIGIVLSILVVVGVSVFGFCDNTILRWVAYSISALSAIINFILVQKVFSASDKG